MVEWGPETDPVRQIARDLANETKPADMIALSPGTVPLEDDQPVNEYYVVRKALRHLNANRNPTVLATKELTR
jgi:hypothetical protein